MSPVKFISLDYGVSYSRIASLPEAQGHVNSVLDIYSAALGYQQLLTSTVLDVYHLHEPGSRSGLIKVGA